MPDKNISKKPMYKPRRFTFVCFYSSLIISIPFFIASSLTGSNL